MHRLFVAIRPPAVIRQQLLDVMGGVSGARWQTDEQLHLTLRFIGEVNRHAAEDVVAALGAVHHPRFEIRVEGLGTFNRRGAPEVIWAGVQPHEPLHGLHKKVDQACARVGIAPDTRAFHPHITLARMKRGAGPVGHLVTGSGGFATPTFEVTHFGLFESQLTPEGAVYTQVERYALR